MVTGLELPLIKVVEGSLSAAAKSVGSRLWSSVDPVARRSRHRSTEILTVLSGLEFAGRLSKSRLLDALPGGTNVHEVETLLDQVEVQGLLHELVYAQIVGAGELKGAEVRENFAMVIANLLPECRHGETVAFGKQLYDDVSVVVMDLTKELKLKNPGAWADLQSVASTNLIASTLDAIDRHNDSLKRFSDPTLLRAARQWETTYRLQAEKAHGFIEPPDFERKRKVPIESLYVAPRILPFGGVGDEGGSAQSIDAFSHVIDRTVLLGDPGGGKSTASSYLTYQAAKDDDGPLPLLVVLREFAKSEPIDQPIADYIASRMANFYQCKPPADVIESLLLSGRAIVIFDGLDELIDTTRRRDITSRVEMFSQRYPLTRILVTSRRVGYEQAQLDVEVFTTYVLSGFENNDVSDYVQRWFEHVEHLEGPTLDETAKHFVVECSSVPDLTSTPLMLSLMCIIYRGQGYIPKNRPDVYERCAILLFDKWDSSRKIYVDLRASAYIDPAMKHLAFWMLTENAGTEAVTESALVDEATKYLHDAFESDQERRRAAQEFVDFCRGRAWVLSDAGTTAAGEALFKFTHRTFMEYFAAYELTRRSDGPEDLAKKLLPRIAAAEWDVVGQLAVQIQNKHSAAGAERTFRQLLKDGRRRTPKNRDNVLAFITRCLNFMDVPPAFAREVAHRALSSAWDLAQARVGLIRHQSLALSALGTVSLETRPCVSNELELSLVAMLSQDEGKADDHSHFARTLLLHWPSFLFGFFNSSSVALEQHQFWTAWSKGVIEKNVDKILVESRDNMSIWQAALHTDVVDMGRFLDVTADWVAAPLDGLVEAVPDQILGVSYVAWASYAFDVMTRDINQAPGMDRDEMRASYTPIWKSLKPKLAVFARLVDEMDPPPWVTLANWRFYFEGPRSYESRTGDPDADWAMCVLTMIAIESVTDSSALQDTDGLVDMLWKTRIEGASCPDDLFVGTIFDALATGRADLLREWLVGNISLVAQSTGTEMSSI